MDHYHVWKTALGRSGEAKAMFRLARAFRSRSSANDYGKARNRDAVGVLVLACKDPHCRKNDTCIHQWRPAPGGVLVCELCEATSTSRQLRNAQG